MCTVWLIIKLNWTFIFWTINTDFARTDLRGPLLGKNNHSDQLLGADVNEALVSTLLSLTGHEVEDGLAAQNLVAHINTQHNAGLVL